MAVISLENVNFSYNKKTNTLTDINLSVEKGEYLAIVGRNGSGKSTLAKILNGLIKADSGKVSIFGLDPMNKEEVSEIRKRVGIVFQNPDNQLVASIVEDDVAFGPENIGLKREEIGKRIEFALQSVGLKEFGKSATDKLSGGQKQRVAIAGVLALMPEVLVLDESTSMLDPEGRKEVLGVVEELNKKGTTVIVITHYMEEVVGCDRVVVMGGGKIALVGTPREIFAKDEKLKELGLELPIATYIAKKLREKGAPIGEVLTQEELRGELCSLMQKK